MNIGYGNIAPKTDIGKLFVIVYASIGLPLTMILLAACVMRMEERMMKIIRFVQNHCYCMETKISSFFAKCIQLFIVSIGFWSFVMIFPALGFWYFESPEWDLMDAFDNVFMSMTTIGLGDFVAGEEQKNDFWYNLYRNCVPGKKITQLKHCVSENYTL